MAGGLEEDFPPLRPTGGTTVKTKANPPCPPCPPCHPTPTPTQPPQEVGQGKSESTIAPSQACPPHAPTSQESTLQSFAFGDFPPTSQSTPINISVSSLFTSAISTPVAPVQSQSSGPVVRPKSPIPASHTSEDIARAILFDPSRMSDPLKGEMVAPPFTSLEEARGHFKIMDIRVAKGIILKDSSPGPNSPYDEKIMVGIKEQIKPFTNQNSGPRFPDWGYNAPPSQANLWPGYERRYKFDHTATGDKNYRDYWVYEGKYRWSTPKRWFLKNPIQPRRDITPYPLYLPIEPLPSTADTLQSNMGDRVMNLAFLGDSTARDIINPTLAWFETTQTIPGLPTSGYVCPLYVAGGTTRDCLDHVDKVQLGRYNVVVLKLQNDLLNIFGNNYAEGNRPPEEETLDIQAFFKYLNDFIYEMRAKWIGQLIVIIGMNPICGPSRIPEKHVADPCALQFSRAMDYHFRMVVRNHAECRYISVADIFQKNHWILDPLAVCKGPHLSTLPNVLIGREIRNTLLKLYAERADFGLANVNLVATEVATAETLDERQKVLVNMHRVWLSTAGN